MQMMYVLAAKNQPFSPNKPDFNLYKALAEKSFNKFLRFFAIRVFGTKS